MTISSVLQTASEAEWYKISKIVQVIHWAPKCCMTRSTGIIWRTSTPKQITIGDAPEQESFRTPVINPDSLPDIKDWLK